MNKTLNGSGFQSPYYDYLDAMVAATPSIFCKYDKEKNSFPAATLVVHRGDVARSIADSVMSKLKIYHDERKNDIRYYRAAFMYLLTHTSLYRDEVRETKNGWIDPVEWTLKQINENSKLYQLVIQCEEASHAAKQANINSIRNL